MSETSQKIEALIFASSKPISEKEIQKRESRRVKQKPKARGALNKRRNR